MANHFKAHEDASRLNAIFEHVAEGIIIIDDQGIIERINPAAVGMFGYNQEEVVGKNIKMLMPEPYRSEHDDYMERYKQTGEPHIIGIGREVSGLSKNGTVFPFHLSVSEVQLEDRVIFTGIIFDLSERKRNEQQLEEYAHALEQSNRELEQFAYVASHDLQEPLRKIFAFSDWIYQKESRKLTEKGNDYLQRIRNAGDRLQHLIDGLLTFSRLTTRAQPYAEVDLTQVLDEVFEDLEVTINEAQAQIKREELPLIEGERLQLRQLFQNLISNALKFKSEERDLVISVSQFIYKDHQPVGTVEEADNVQIIIEDNGVGFDNKYASQIFNVFNKLHDRSQKGAGMGLSICWKIVSEHNGTITAEGSPGSGSTFVVNLPIRQKNYTFDQNTE